MDIQSNVDDFPRMTPVAQQVHTMEFKPSVPDISLLSEPGSGNARLRGKENLADDYRVLLKKYPLQTVNVNSQQTLTDGKSELLHNRNPLVGCNSKEIDGKPNMHCNDENEPPVPAKAPRPHVIPEIPPTPRGPSAIINSHLTDAVLNGNPNYPPHHSVRFSPPTQSNVLSNQIINLPLDTPKRYVRAPVGKRSIQSSYTAMGQSSRYAICNTGGNGISLVNNASYGNEVRVALPAGNIQMSSNFANAESGHVSQVRQNVQFCSADPTIAQKTVEVASNSSSPRGAVVSYPSQNLGTACGNNHCRAEKSPRITNLQISNSLGQSDQPGKHLDFKDLASTHVLKTDVANAVGEQTRCRSERIPHVTNFQSSNDQPNVPMDCQGLAHKIDFAKMVGEHAHCRAERPPYVTDFHTYNSVGHADQPDMSMDCQGLEQKTDFAKMVGERTQSVGSSPTFGKESGSFEIQKIIEEQDNKLCQLQEQIQLLLQAQTLEEKKEPQRPSLSRQSQVLEDDEKSEVYKMLKHQDEQLQRLQEQIKTVLEIHQSSSNNNRRSPDGGLRSSPADTLRRSSDSGLGASPSDAFQRSKCNSGVVTNLHGKTEPSSCESPKNEHHCEHKKHTTTHRLPASCRENDRALCARCNGCSCGSQADAHNSSLMLTSLNIPTDHESTPSLPPSFHVDINDYDPSCCLSQTSREVANRSPVLGESASYLRDEVHRTGSSDESYDEAERGADAFCQKLLGNINCLLGKQNDGEINGTDKDDERYGFDSFLLPKLNYQTFHLSSLDSELGDLALKYLGQQQIKAALSSTKMFVEHKPTDTTLYGLSPTNISYSTKMYLERYGLVPSGCKPQEEKQGASESQSFWIFSDLRKLNKTQQVPHGVIDTDMSKILDLETLKKQPKLL